MTRLPPVAIFGLTWLLGMLAATVWLTVIR
jgi:hypothetical protein